MNNSDLEKTLRNKKLRKIALIALAVFLAVGVLASFSLEGKDSKIEDGQGNIVVENAGDAEIAVSATDADESAQDDEADLNNTTETDTETAPDEDKTKQSENDKNVAQTVKEKVKSADKAKDIKLTEEEKEETKAKDIEVDNSSDFTASNGGNVAMRPDTPQPVTVTLEIRCDTLSSHMEYLENESIREYIPADGTILARTTYSGTTDNTVFDALNTLCRNNDIQLEFNYTPLYESNYIEGINFLYEFDGGPQSGWMYKVNDWFPNYGCSSYYLSDGDTIVWLYTCRGLGEDVGQSGWN